MEITKEYLDSFETLMSSEDFTTRLAKMRGVDEIKALFRENGLEISNDALAVAEKKIADYESTGELDEDTLALVSGGKLTKQGFWAGVGIGLIAAVYSGNVAVGIGVAIGCWVVFSMANK